MPSICLLYTSQVHAKNIFILPNNKNIILAANQAKALTEDKNIIVIPTKTVPQGITAVINFVPEKSPEENAALMEEEISRVRTGQLTYAVRDTHIDDKTIHAGDIMGVGDHAILSVGKDIDTVAPVSYTHLPERKSGSIRMQMFFLMLSDMLQTANPGWRQAQIMTCFPLMHPY